VELGKAFATSLLPMVEGSIAAVGRDSSTVGLIATARALRIADPSGA
jgi:hypothetical protein